MRKETAIKVSKAFKEFLDDKKEKGEDFETTIKRLITIVNPVNPSQLTSEPGEKHYIKTIKAKKTDSVQPIKEFDNLADFNLEVHKRKLENEKTKIAIKERT